ncbi:MAG: pyruvate formate-lyase [Ruminococcaceae bacterium]|nr:pyruvate formate-lyase [Oscillospiraceae bacterium]
MSEKLLQYILDKKHHAFRVDYTENLAAEYSAKGMPPEERMADRFERLCRAQVPHILPDEQICFMRTTKQIPDCFTEEEWAKIKSEHFIHELGYISNVSPNYEAMIADGLLARRESADEYGKRAIDNIIDLADRYKAEAERVGRDDIAKTLERVPRYGATNFREALQFFRILHFSLWLEGNYHNTVGRFDKYMYPYFKADMDAGVYTSETALALVEDFFLSFNKDSDLYIGVQQGDNGQSMVLGGIDENGNDCFSELTKLCLVASRNLKMIDPKINLRVSKKTPLEQYELGTELTRAGLGFPQYSNDDIVIDGLIKKGYAPEDAANYVVAACWEFIIPKCGFDVANIAALSFPKMVDRVLHKDFVDCATFDDVMAAVKREIAAECDEITAKVKNLWFVPSPFLRLLFDEIKYQNFGVHGTGIATATDSLAAIRKYVYEEKSISAADMLAAVDANFENTPELLEKLRNEAPKMGNNDDAADSISVELLDMFADALDGRKNCQGGVWRAGTGSAMYYLWHADEIGASPDGRRKGEPFGTNFSVSLFAKIAGPVSVVKSFTKQHFAKAINGGPLTLEFHNSVFRGEDAITKVASLVKYFIDNGGHQLQLNAVNLETMKDAQAHPENYQRLVVRIWGWSAYFVELDKEYQDHVIARQEYTV